MRLPRGDLDNARDAARDIDKPDSKIIRAIVSVMMLREGWDVRNVTVGPLGLRPFTAKSDILPEQVIGRVADHERCGVPTDLHSRCSAPRDCSGAARSTRGRRRWRHHPPTMIPARSSSNQFGSARRLDIAIPITKPTLVREIRKLENPDPTALELIWGQAELDRAIGDVLRLEFMTTETEVHLAEITLRRAPAAGVAGGDHQQGREPGRPAQPIRRGVSHHPRLRHEPVFRPAD